MMVFKRKLFFFFINFSFGKNDPIKKRHHMNHEEVSNNISISLILKVSGEYLLRSVKIF